ncbi:MAG: hypothetical protein AB8B51_04265 [Sedimentitalea sp.]
MMPILKWCALVILSLAVFFAARRLAEAGVVERTWLFTTFGIIIPALFLLFLVSVAFEVGLRKVTSAAFKTKAPPLVQNGVRRGQIRHRFPAFVFGIGLGGLFLFIAGAGLPKGELGWGALLLAGVGGVGVYTIWETIWLMRYFYAYDATSLTVWGMTLKAQTHTWSDIKEIQDGVGKKLLVFATTGKARIPAIVEGRDALLKFAREKLNNG